MNIRAFWELPEKTNLMGGGYAIPQEAVAFPGDPREPKSFSDLCRYTRRALPGLSSVMWQSYFILSPYWLILIVRKIVSKAG